MCKILLHKVGYILDCLQLKIYSIGSLLKQMQRFLLMVGALPNPALRVYNAEPGLRISKIQKQIFVDMPRPRRKATEGGLMPI